jgi:hypothetical protein
MPPHAMPSGLRQTAAYVMNILVFETFPARGGLVPVAHTGWVFLTLSVLNKQIHLNSAQTRTSNTWERTELPQIRKPLPSMIAEKVIFTAEEHLKTQRQIERRAREIWCAGGCRDGTALGDWLQAEREVLEQFIWAYARRDALRQSSRPRASVGCARKKTEARILKRRGTMAGRDLQPTSALG